MNIAGAAKFGMSLNGRATMSSRSVVSSSLMSAEERPEVLPPELPPRGVRSTLRRFRGGVTGGSLYAS